MFVTCSGAILLLLDYYSIILTCNTAGVAGKIARGYPSTEHLVSHPFYFVDVHIVNALVCFHVTSYFFPLNFSFYSVHYIVNVDRPCFTC